MQRPVPITERQSLFPVPCDAPPCRSACFADLWPVSLHISFQFKSSFIALTVDSIWFINADRQSQVKLDMNLIPGGTNCKMNLIS